MGRRQPAKQDPVTPSPMEVMREHVAEAAAFLKTLALGPQHGWGISQRIQQISENVLRVNQGSLYPALQRLDTAGWI